MLGSHRHPPILGGCPYSSERKAILHIRLSMAVVFAIGVIADGALGRFSQTRRAFQSNSQSVYVKPSRLYSAEMLSLQCSDALSTVQRCCLYSAVTLSLKGAAAGADFPNR